MAGGILMAASGKKKKILLVAMPWQQADAPSLALGLLKAALKESSLEAEAWLPAPRLARKMGSELYWRVANQLHPLLGEAFFAAARRPDFPYERFERVLVEAGDLTAVQVAKTRRAVERFCRELREEQYWSNFEIVGFSVTFNQLQASLWAAEEARKTGGRVVFGGFLAQGELGRELLNNGCLDAVIAGPGEEALGEWLKANTPPGFMTGAPLHKWFRPDYGDFFENQPPRIRSAGTLLLEASRGCEHGGCSFCAQNSRSGRTIKPVARLAEDLETFSRLYPARQLEFADTSFPPESLTCSPLMTRLRKFANYAECRALKDKEMAALARAGFQTVQIGVESLHTEVLRRMNKGTTLLDNIACLRDSARHELEIYYNIILDMPGTSRGELREMVELLPWLHHLRPPSALVSFQLQRGSPIFKRPHRYGLKITGHHPHHEFLTAGHPPFYFQFTALAPAMKSDLEAAHQAFSLWTGAYDYRRPFLTAKRLDHGLLISDRRSLGGDGPTGDYKLSGAAGEILWACRQIQAAESLAGRWGPAFQAAADELTRRKLWLMEDGRYLALPVGLPKSGCLPRKKKPAPLESCFAPD